MNLELSDMQYLSPSSRESDGDRRDAAEVKTSEIFMTFDFSLDAEGQGAGDTNSKNILPTRGDVPHGLARISV